MLQERNLYLPNLKLRVITADYLLKVSRGEYFSLRIDQIRYAPYERRVWSNIDLVSWMAQRIHPQQLGFGDNRYPDRKWLLKVAYTLEPNLEVFTGGEFAEELVAVPVEFLEANRFFDAYVKPSKSPIFLKSEEAKVRENSERINKRLVKKQRRTNYLNSEQIRLMSEISDLQAELDANS